MTMITSLHNITSADCKSTGDTDCLFFRTTRYGVHFTMHLPPGTGQAVADAINAAVAPQAAPADEVAE